MDPNEIFVFLDGLHETDAYFGEGVVRGVVSLWINDE